MKLPRHWLGKLCRRFGLRLRVVRRGANTRVDPEKLRIQPAVEGLETRLLPSVPTVSAVSPAAGPASSAGGACSITGTNFVGVTHVYFGSVSVSSFTVDSSTSILTMPPSESYGTVDVTVQNGSGTSATNSGDQYTYTLVTLTNPGTQTSTAGSPVSLHLSATAQPSGTLSYAASSLPSGLSINSTTGVISGTPSGTPSYVTATASANTDFSYQSFYWNILAVPLSEIPVTLAP